MILCAGEALIDMLPRESKAGEDAFAPVPGGAVFNTAIALGRLGIPAGLFTGLSTDLFGQMLETSLKESGVDSSLARRSDRPTTLAFVQLTNGSAEYAFYDENTAGRKLTRGDLPKPGHLANTQVLFLGGISLVSEPCGSVYEALAKREAGRRLVMIDPNVRPGFISDEPGYRARVDRMTSYADIVKVSDEDLRWLAKADEDTDLVSLAEDMLAKGPALVCVTEGAKGATAYMKGQQHLVVAERVEVADTVGAGDTFNAGVMAGLFRSGITDRKSLEAISQNDLQDAVRLGVRASAITVSRAGANPPTAEELGL